MTDGTTIGIRGRRVARRLAAVTAVLLAVLAVAAGWLAYRSPTLALSYALDAALCGTARRPATVRSTAPAPAATPAVRPPPAGAPPR
jgi:hypothetical protein